MGFRRQGYSPLPVRGVYVFYPNNLSGLALWLKADVGTYQSSGGSTATADGDPIGEWQDQSGSGNHAAQSSAGAKPTLKIVSGVRLVRFDGSDRLATPSFLLSATTVFAVMKAAGHASVAILMEHGANALNVDGFWMAIGKIAQGGGGRTNGISGAISVFFATDNWWDDNNWNVAALRNGAAGSQIYKNSNTAGVSNGTNVGSLGTNVLSIGNRADGSLPLIGDIKEIITYNRQLTTAEFAAVMSYLGARHAITIS